MNCRDIFLEERNRGLTKSIPNLGIGRDGGKSGRGAVETRVAIGRSVRFKIIQNGKHPCVPRRTFLTRYKKEGESGMRQSC